MHVLSFSGRSKRMDGSASTFFHVCTRLAALSSCVCVCVACACRHTQIHIPTTVAVSFQNFMVCLGPASSLVATLSLATLVLWPSFLVIHESPLLRTPTTTTTYQAPPAVEVCICPELSCSICGRPLDFQYVWSQLLLVILVAGLVGFLAGRRYERQSFVVGRVVSAGPHQVTSSDRLPGKNRKKVGQL